MHKKQSFVLLTLVSTLLLSACASAPQPLPVTQWEKHQSQVQAIQSFTAKGKVAFISDAERVSAQFYWEQNQDELALTLTNFLGGSILKMTVTPTHATLIDRDGNSHIGENATQLIEDLTGLELPIQDMMLWIKGLPSQDNGYALGKHNRLVALEQFKANPNKGWQVTYKAYDEKTNNLLPTKLTMIDAEQKVNLVISEWIYPTP